MENLDPEANPISAQSVKTQMCHKCVIAQSRGKGTACAFEGQHTNIWKEIFLHIKNVLISKVLIGLVFH